MSENKRQRPRQIQIDLPDDVAEGIYANFAVISHSPSEFVMDFARMVPGTQKAKVQARLIMTPINAKMFIKALEENIEKFEGKFGEIKSQSKPPHAKGSIGFGGEKE